MRWPIPAAAWRSCARTRAREPGTTGSTGSAATSPSTATTAGDLEQWEYEVTSGGWVRYATGDHSRTVWLIYASPRHPKDTDR
jgi:hypothetical protein